MSLIKAPLQYQTIIMALNKRGRHSPPDRTANQDCQYAPHSKGEFFCWYSHLLYASAIDELEKKGVLSIPEYVVHTNRISNLRRAEVASLTSNVTLDDIFVTAYGHRLVLSVPTKDREDYSTSSSLGLVAIPRFTLCLSRHALNSPGRSPSHD